MKFLLTLVLIITPCLTFSQSPDLYKRIDKLAEKYEEDVIGWRRHFHQFPELSNQEFETSKMIAAHLRSLGMEVQTGVAKTGVVGVLIGGKPGPVVALRADMDALPVTENSGLPFASRETATYIDSEVGVMHACGHDTHMAILMGAATILAELKAELPGTVKFIFQPAEEGGPVGEEFGAQLMVKEGVLNNPAVDVIFGLHIQSKTTVNRIRYKPGGTMASADYMRILVKGTQTHGGYPWEGVDPIVTSALIINGLQTIVARQIKLTKEPAVISIGKIHGGVRNNIIPSEVEIIGTIRAFDTGMQDQIHEKIRKTAINIAESQGAEAEVEIYKGYPVTYNNPDLTARMLPTLNRVAGMDNVLLSEPMSWAEDFSFYAREVPGFFFFLGGMSEGLKPEEVASHHTPDFFCDESGFKLGVRTMTNLALDYLFNPMEDGLKSGN